ncbi:MAG: glutaredoxin family protein [Thiotrichales bacterium]|nr:MAG: glutaredoxin family protein [Thiotrichales bacterium]
MPVQLTLYIREGCHLCDDMEQALGETAAELDFEITRVPIDNNAELEQAYGSKVPVLTCGSGEICHYFLDLQALKRVIA